MATTLNSKYLKRGLRIGGREKEYLSFIHVLCHDLQRPSLGPFVGTEVALTCSWLGITDISFLSHPSWVNRPS
jgi:hypothetical protein